MLTCRLPGARLRRAHRWVCLPGQDEPLWAGVCPRLLRVPRVPGCRSLPRTVSVWQPLAGQASPLPFEGASSPPHSPSITAKCLGPAGARTPERRCSVSPGSFAQALNWLGSSRGEAPGQKHPGPRSRHYSQYSLPALGWLRAHSCVLVPGPQL